MKRRATLGGSLPGDSVTSIRVNVVRATNLAAKHQGRGRQSSDPYALLRVGTIERRTRTIQNCLHPVFKEEFEFREVSREHAILRIALYDADALTEDHFLGEVIVPICSLSDADQTPTWRTLDVRPGSTEFVSGELCVQIWDCRAASVQPSSDRLDVAAKPALKRRRSSMVARDSFGATPFSRTYVIEPSELSFGDEAPLGQGGFGTVRRGEFRGLPVAVKTLLVREGIKKKALVEEFRTEVAMLAKVSHHPKLCLFMGASITEPLTLVSELMTGSVRNVLDKPRKESFAALPWPRRVEILLDAALGMAYLHGMQVVHRDMKADNLLLDEHGTTKVADFGLSKTLRNNALEHSDVGTPGFKAPEMYDESMDADGYSLPVDVFAYGATVYEMLTFGGKNWGWPFGWALDLASDEQVERAVRGGKPPTALGGTPLPGDCPPALRRVYEDCIAFEPGSRPEFATIVPRLRELLSQLREDSGTD